MRRILIVGDDPRLTALAAEAVRSVGFEAHVAHDVGSASRIALRIRPDVIVLDIDMPDYAALELHEYLKFSHRVRDAAFLYLSNEDTLQRRASALRRGAKAFLAKPAKPEDFSSLMRTTMSSGALNPSNALAGAS